VIQHAEAIFEDGPLRPLEPLSLQDKQHVLLRITDASAPGANSNPMQEQEWLRAHGQEYCGQWVALKGVDLVSHDSYLPAADGI